MGKDSTYGGYHKKTAQGGLKRSSVDGGSLDTLGIVAPPQCLQGSQDGQKPLISLDKYIKRQKAKAITMGQLMPLIDLNSNLKKSYWNTYHCNRHIEQKGNELKSSYCDARWCTVCNRVRMAKMINAYGPTLMSLDDLHFVTLTAPNVSGKDLRLEVDNMLSTWTKIRKFISKYRKGIKLRGMRKLECTFNPKSGFNPHFHLIISGLKESELIVSKWLELVYGASPKGQDIRKANEGSLIELFKYTAKGVVKGKYYPFQMDTIYHSLYYRKTYYPIGIKKIVEEDIEGIEVQEVDFLDGETNLFEWDAESKEWFDSNGNSLTNHAIDGDLFDWIESLAADDTN